MINSAPKIIIKTFFALSLTLLLLKTTQAAAPDTPQPPSDADTYINTLIAVCSIKPSHIPDFTHLSLKDKADMNSISQLATSFLPKSADNRIEKTHKIVCGFLRSYIVIANFTGLTGFAHKCEEQLKTMETLYANF